MICSLWVKSGEWNSSSETLIVSVDGLILGTYNYTLHVDDIDGNSITDTVLVTVNDETLPTINSPNNLTLTEGQTNVLIVWVPSDLHPDSYFVYRNDAIIDFGDWNSTGEYITAELDGLTAGEYNYTVVVIDVGGNTITDTVMITVISSDTTTTTTTETPTETNTTPTITPPSGAIDSQTLIVIVMIGSATAIIIVIIIIIGRSRRS